MRTTTAFNISLFSVAITCIVGLMIIGDPRAVRARKNIKGKTLYSDGDGWTAVGYLNRALFPQSTPELIREIKHLIKESKPSIDK